MELREKAVKDAENKFVITEDRAYFLPCSNREEAPQFTEILKEIFDLDDPEVSRNVEERLSEGKIIMGYYDPSNEQVEVHVPLEASEYVEKRLREVLGVYESPYIRRRKEKQPEPDYIHELNVLRAMVRQEDRQGDVGWGGSWTKERYHRLKEKHPEALMAFEAELRWEKKREQHKKETLEKYSPSPYIEEVEGWPDTETKEKYLKDLKRMKHLMILFKIGYGSQAMAMAFTNLKNAYPEAYEAFKEELGVV